jgi:uncharacterized protein YrzB (UPF0473 family)
MWDERLSTQAVARSVSSNRYIDEMAAVYILQGYLDCLNTKKKGIDMEEQIIMLDEEGNEQPFNILSARDKDGTVYLLAAEETGNDDDEAEIVHFKCVATEGEDMVFEIVDEGEEDFKEIMELFDDEYVRLGIEIEE